jgi:hypothetical protein
VRQHPLELPLAPRWPEAPSHHFRCKLLPRPATGGRPPPSRCHIIGRTPLSNKEAPFPQALAALFGRVLRKKHAVVIGLKRRFCLSQSETNTALISAIYRKFCGSALGRIGSPYLRQVEYRARRSRGMPTPVRALWTANGLISGQSMGRLIRNRKIWRRRRDSNPGYAFRAYNGLANRRLQPLGHVSVCEKAV